MKPLTIVSLLTVVAEVVSVVLDGSVDLCSFCSRKAPSTRSLAFDACRAAHPNATLDSTCCTDDTSVFALDLRQCDITAVSPRAFQHANQSAKLIDLLAVDLSENVFESNQFNESSLHGLRNLQLLLLPMKFPSCPSTKRNDFPWLDDRSASNRHYCANQTDSCLSSNFTCPDHSECAGNGPGWIECVCMDGYHGYRCLRKGSFPGLWFFLITTVVTLALTAALWCYTRKHAKYE